MFSGCSKEYNLTITDDKFIEELKVTLIDNEDNKKMIDNNFYPLHASTEEIYIKKINIREGYLQLDLKYEYSKEEFENANSVNQCFKEKKILLNDDDYYYLELKKMNDCVTDFNFDINIITNNQVVSNNADKVNKNKYTWHVSEDNKDNFKLKIKIAKGVYNNTILTKEKIIAYVVLGIIGIGIIVFIPITVKRMKNKNKI